MPLFSCAARFGEIRTMQFLSRWGCPHQAKPPPTRVAVVHLRRCHSQTQTLPSSASSDPCSPAALQIHPTPTPPCGQSMHQRHRRPTRTCLATRVVSTCMRGLNHACACTTHTFYRAHLWGPACAACHARAWQHTRKGKKEVSAAKISPEKTCQRNPQISSLLVKGRTRAQ